MTVDKTLLIVVLAGAAIAGTYASCANSCSGHGTCGAHDRCSCYPMFEGTDCSLKSCPSGPAFVDGANAGDVHAYSTCSGRGTCDHESGECQCADGFTGYNCGRSVCPNDCSGHGQCTFAKDISSAGYNAYDGGMTRSCVCDGYYTGADCSSRQCPRGDDPLTTEIECQGVASGLQAHEVQEITINADTMLAGEMTLTYTDAYGQSWTTTPIAVGGDNKFDLRLGSSNNAKCSFVYVDAMDSPAQYADGTSSATDFAGRTHTSPADASAGLEATLCNAATAAELDAIISHHSAVSNVHVTKSADVSGGAKFEITIGGFRAQTGVTAGEIGAMSVIDANSASGTTHNLGDHSEDIARALTSLPYNVIPSVTVTKQAILASDYATADVVNGNAIQQKYQVTFSDAANAGDQNLLQCNAAPCNDDGCAPRSAGVNHEKFISTTTHHDDKIADYKTAIVATGQGGFWLRSHRSTNWAVTTWTSGKYFIHRDLGNGKTSSATFQFNDDAAAIQTALQTVEGWSGVSVTCNSGADSYAKGKGIPGKAGHSATEHGLECYVTYAVGYDDGGRLPTMTYTNFNGAQSTNTNGLFECVNEVCAVQPGTLGTSGVDNFGVGNGAGTSNTQAKFENVGGYVYITATSGHQQTCTFGGAVSTTVGHTVTQASSGAVGHVGATASSATQKFVITNGIEFDNDGPIVINGEPTAVAAGNCAAANRGAFKTGTYEIIRTAQYSASVTTFLIFAPGQADCATYTACFDPNGIANTFGKVHDTTPLMPMWPSISNSIALHDTTLRIILDAGMNTPDPMLDAPASNPVTQNLKFNIGYGTLGYGANIDFTSYSTCSDVQAHLIKYKDGGATGFSTTNTPYPSLLDPNDATKSICDCRKMEALQLSSANIMWDITCPAFIGQLLWPTVSGDVVRGATGSRRAAKITTTPVDVSGQNVYINFLYIRQTPPSGLTTKVAVGDTITVLGSNSNTNKQYTVKSFVDDGRWGSGKYNIWSTAAGYLGNDDNTNGMVHSSSIVLSNLVDYRAYGDFVPFAKVDPAPTSEYQITEMKAVGQNSTTFSRTLESISTTATSIVSLTFYDPAPVTSGAGAGDANVAGITGTFQLIYDGQETAVMQALTSAADMQESLAGLSNIGSVAPTVTRSPVSAISESVTWSITFNAIAGDAKKLTFKYVDTIGTERQSSNLVGSDTSTALANTVTKLDAGAGTGTYYAVNKITNIVVQYLQEGSTFYDDLDITAASVHDELAADVTVGTTFTVQSSEVIQYFLFDEAGATTAAITEAEVCGGTDPFITFEYNGKVSAPVAVCAGSAFNSDAAMTTGVQTVTGLETATCAWSGDDVAGRNNANARTEFALAFPWAASHTGAAQAMLACTLPLGVDGSSFKIHAMLDPAAGWRIGGSNGQAYQYRKRHNNGRSFTVTQAYENKVADMTHFSRVPALSGVTTGEKTNMGSAYGVVAASVTGGSSISAANWNPGTYYNVKLCGGEVASGTGAIQTDAFAKVVVTSGGITSIEITSGGIKVDPKVAATLGYVLKCDQRLNSDFTCTQADGAPTTANHKMTVTIGDDTTDAKWNVLTVSATIGTDFALNPTGADFCATASAVKRNVIGTCTSETDDTNSLKDVRFDCTCGGTGGKILNSCKVVGGGSGTTVGSVTIAAMIDNYKCTMSGNNAGVAGTVDATQASFNTFYHVAGFYDTGTPKFFADALHEGVLDGELMQSSGALTIMGGISGASNYLYRGRVGVNEVQMFKDLNSPGFQGAGLNRGTAATRETASVVAGEGGSDSALGGDQTATHWYVDHAQKYQYAGRGFDQLTVTPSPDRMSGQKIVVTYHGAAGSCSVKEVDRGTHESSVCSGRGNCDGATGTCVCDEGYTLEACSEQTVLV